MPGRTAWSASSATPPAAASAQTDLLPASASLNGESLADAGGGNVVDVGDHSNTGMTDINVTTPLHTALV